MPKKAHPASWKRAAGVAAAAVLVALAVAVFLLKASPAVYRRTAPTGRDEAAAAGFDERVVNHVGNVFLDRSGVTRLDLEVTEAMVNARIARFLAEEDRAGQPVPPVLHHLRIGFEPGVLVLATRVGHGLTSAVVSHHLALQADPDGNLVLRPVGTKAGLLPLPEGAVDYVRRAVGRKLDRRQADGGDEQDLPLWRSVLDGLSGTPVSLGRGRRRIRLEEVEVERGVLRMRGRRDMAPSTGPADPAGDTPAAGH